MRWQKSRRSSNVEDRRGRAVARGATYGGGAVLLALIASLFLGEDPTTILDMLSGGQQAVQTQSAPPESDDAADFVSAVLGDTEVTWEQIFRDAGARYPHPSLVLYDGSVTSACGYGMAATGPFYCPGDSKVYLDLSFFRELQRLGADGDFAVAYVIAHEVGHHIQNVTGVEQQVRQLQRRSSREQANRLSVRMELQADCYSGVWAHHAGTKRDLLEQGDLEEGLRAAAAVGDDRLQKMSGQRVQPESFTHGTSRQRMEWFRRGLESGTIEVCDTFSSNE